MNKLYLRLFWLFCLTTFSSICFAASGTNVAPISSPLTIKYPGSRVSAAPRITDVNYQSIPDCAVNLAHCPDINGDPPRGVSQTQMNQDCPPYCKVTRRVSTVGAGWTRRTTSTEAVCPQGYASVAHFNVQPELQNFTTTQTISPVIGLSLYNCYNDNGYFCTANTSVDFMKRSGCQSSSTPQYTEDQLLDNYPVSSSYPAGTVVTITTVSHQCYCKGSDCNLHCSCNVSHDNYFWYHASPITCSAIGIAASCKTYLPVTLICARTESVWMSH